MDDHPAPPEMARTRPRRRSGVRTLLVLVAACAALMWSARGVWEDHRDPARPVARRLRSSDPATRAEAAADLGRFAMSPSGFALKALARALSDPDPRVRDSAAGALGPMIGEALRLGAFVPEARAAAPALLAATRDRDPRVRLAALGAVAAMFPGPPPGADAAPVAADPEEAAAALAERLSDPDPAVREAAFPMLRSVGGAAPVAPTPALITALESDSPGLRERAAQTLAGFTQGLDAAIPALFRALDRPTPPDAPEADRRADSAIRNALGTVRPSAASVPYLVALLDHPRPDLRALAAGALGRAEPRAISAVPALLRLLAEPAPAGRQMAPGLEGDARVLPDSDPACAAAWALARIAPAAEEPDAIREALIAALGHGPPARRAAAASALGDLRRFALPAVPALVAALRETIGRAPAGHEPAVAAALARIAPDTPAARPAVAALTDALLAGHSVRRFEIRAGDRTLLVAPEPRGEDRSHLDRALLQALAPFGPDAAPAAPKVRLLRDSPNHRPLAEQVLMAIESEIP